MSSQQLDEEAIFHIARKLDDLADREQYLNQICAGNASLRQRVEALLDVHEKENRFLKSASTESTATLDHTPLTESPGTTIGRYRLMEQIGEGGMGVVFVAEQQKPLQRKVALKVIKPGMDSKSVIARFEAERQALALMDHPNIAKVLDAGTTDTGRPYFVMELVRGIQITEYCDQKKLNISERLELFVQVCRAIQHAHQKGIIHRDVKPSNVLVTEQDGNAVPKVIDFGVAKALSQRLTEKTIYTNFQTIVGTPLYMSPEQAALSNVDVDTRSDVYSLGVLLYELLTGTTPFDKQQFEQAVYDEIRRIIREEEPPKASTRISGLGASAATVAEHRQTDQHKLSRAVKGDLDWIVMKALEKDRGLRYETALEFSRDVQRFLNDDAVLARPPSFTYQTRKLMRRHRRIVVVAVSLFILFSAGLLGTTTGWRVASKAWGEAKRREQDANLAKDNLRRQNYAYTMEAAFQAWQAGSLRRLKWLLDTQASRRDLHGFEYRFLRQRYEENFPVNATFPFDDGINSVAFSPDRKYVAVGFVDGGLQLLDLDSKTHKVLLKNQLASSSNDTSANNTYVAFSPDNYLLAGGGRKGSAWLRLWLYLPDSKSPFTPLDLPVDLAAMHDGSVEWVTVAPDGRFAASAGGGTAVIWELPSGTVRRVLPHGNMMRVAISPDGIVATTAWDDVLKIWDFTGGDPIAEFKLARQPVNVDFSRDGKVLACTDCSGLHIWDIRGTTFTKRLQQLTWRRNRDLAFSPTSSLLATAGSDDSAVRILNLDTGQLTQKHLHDNRLRSLDFSADGQWLVSGGLDGMVKLWDRRAIAINFRRGNPHWSAPIAVSPDSTRVAFAGRDATVTLWNITTGEVQPMSGHDTTVLGAAFSSDGQLASASSDGTVRLWDTKSRESRTVLQEHSGPVSCVAFSPKREWLASGGDNELILWDMRNHESMLLWANKRVDIMAVRFSPDGRFLAAAAYHDKRAMIWDIQKKKTVLKLDFPAEGLESVAFSDDGRSLAIAGRTDKITVWNLETEEQVHVLEGNGNWLTSCDFSTDGKTLVAASPAGEIRFWRMPSGDEAGTWAVDTGVRKVLFTPDGNALLLSSMDGRVEYWRAAPHRDNTRDIEHP